MITYEILITFGIHVTFYERDFFFIANQKTPIS